MSHVRKQHTAGEWKKDSAGRPYRYIDIEGNQYCQWDNNNGPVVLVRSTPRTLPTGPPLGSFPPESHQPAYSIFPRDDRQSATTSYPATGIHQQSTGAALPARKNNEYDERDGPLSNPPNGIIPGSASRNIANTPQSGQAKTDKSQAPPGTGGIGRSSDGTRYIEKDGKILRTVATTRQDPRIDHSPSTVDDVTNRFATMKTKDESLRSGDSRSPPAYAVVPREQPHAAAKDPRDSSARNRISQNGSQGPAFISSEDRSQSRDRVEVHQIHPIGASDSSRDRKRSTDSHLPNRLASDPQKPSPQDLPASGGRTNATQVLLQQPDDTGEIVSVDVGTEPRRPLAAPKTGLETISESGTYKITRIKGDDRYGHSKEMIDYRYVVREDAKNFFSLGRVFALLWHEPAGSHGTDLSDGQYYTGKYGQKVYSTIRRMVVVKQKHGHCTCVPIATYGGQATLKQGLSLADIEAHAVIYMIGTSSAADPREKIVKLPIAVKPARDDQKLHPKSRINFDKIYTIEHNVKVMNVGKVVSESIHNLSLYYYNTHFGD